ncbi:MAG: cell division protein ZapA [bacterium]|nr:cell division protein ZapA [bacterium]
MEKPVTINIMGQTLQVRTSGGEESLRCAVSRLEEKIEMVAKSGVTADSLRLLIYAAIQLAGENIKIEEEINKLEREVDLTSSSMLEIIDLEQDSGK